MLIDLHTHTQPLSAVILSDPEPAPLMPGALSEESRPKPSLWDRGSDSTIR
jgi:hypothetical protein